MDLPQTLSQFGFENSRVAFTDNARAVHSRAAKSPPSAAIVAQKSICDSVAVLLQQDPPGREHLDAFMALERHGQQVGDRLLTQYVEGDAQVRVMEWRAWQSAFNLSHWLIRGCEHFLPHVQAIADARGDELEHGVRVQLFHHLKVEFLLRFLRYKRRSDEQWRRLHLLYRSARERDRRNSPDGDTHTEPGHQPAGKLEQQYLQILLLEAMNCGRFSPREGLWAHRWFARWCSESELQLVPSDGRNAESTTGFVVDLDGADGLRRGPASGPNVLHFDSSPLIRLMERESDSLVERAVSPIPMTPAVRAGQLALLRKLARLFAPSPAEVERRRERHPVTIAVQAIAGFPCIVDELRRSGIRNDRRGNEGNAPTAFRAPVSSASASTSGLAAIPPVPANGMDNDGEASVAAAGGGDDVIQQWQVKDRSDSGCRMRGQIANMNRVIPGSLIAIREDETSPWTVAVVRWFRRLMVDHVEIGVEYLGRRPRFVKMVADPRRELTADALQDPALRCFAALYLPPSDGHPTMPIKTLLLPAGEFKAGCEVMLLSSSATYRMRLSEPIQQQYEFVLTSFGVIGQPAPQSANSQ
ncbi:MAG TPA: hypothetical protein PLW68_05265 [Casimicrobiaceae bacterium]|nr:hypothetical protein [Casimicrobiaceae bacterium]